MKNVAFQKCINPACGTEFDMMQALTACTLCGSLLDVLYHWDQINPPRDLRFFENRRNNLKNIFNRSGVWRFRELLPYVNVASLESYSQQIVSLDGAEGHTFPIHESLVGRYVIGKLEVENNTLKQPPLSADEREFVQNHFYIQFEGQNPTGSFKDNGMTAAFTHAHMVGARRAVCASTGNTSAALAAYARNSGILDAFIFIGEGKIAYGKLSQGLEYGARTIQIKGDFDDAMEAVQKVAAQEKIYVVNSVNPFRLEGQKTIMYRVLEGLSWQAPDWIVVPGGNLGNASAFGKAFMELKALGLINKVPRLAVIQSKGANPLDVLVNERGLKWNGGHVDHALVKAFYAERKAKGIRARTLASAIEIGKPVNLAKCLRALDFTNGVVRSVDDASILDAKAVIGLNGMFGCEPASAASVEGVRLLFKEGVIHLDETVVCICTGHQLKDPDATVGYHAQGADPELDKKMEAYDVRHRRFANRPVAVPNDLDAIVSAMR